MGGKYQWNKNAVSERLYPMPGGLIQMENCQSELVPNPPPQCCQAGCVPYSFFKKNIEFQIVKNR